MVLLGDLQQATLSLNLARVKALLITALISHLIEANIRYFFEARISGPPSWHGKGCSSAIEHSGIRFFFLFFFFNNGTGAGPAGQTTSQKGQVSGFEFTLNKI